MKKAGIKIRVFFPPLLGWLNLRMNYRNHRKIIAIDGRTGFVGGFNVGREYISKDPKSGYWRGTHLEIMGEAAISLQIRFTLDWDYAIGENLFEEVRYFGDDSQYVTQYLDGRISPVWPGPEWINELVAMQIITSGPDAKEPHVGNSYLELFHKAKHSIYIQAPYFIPDDAMLSALKIAALSGVDVRLMAPCKPDHPFIYWAACSYTEELLDYGVKVYIYENGFLHFKSITIDGRVSCYGTANMSIRSFELNFEVNATIYDEEVIGELEEAFMNDLPHYCKITKEDCMGRGLRIRMKEQCSRLLSPLL